MLSVRAYAALKFCIQISNIFKSASFVLDSKNMKVTVKSNTIASKYTPFLSISFVIAHFLFILFRSIQSYLYFGDSSSKMLLQLTLLAQSGLSLSCHLNTFALPEELALFLTQMLQTDHQLSSKINYFMGCCDFQC